jgi:hypothetical protein
MLNYDLNVTMKPGFMKKEKEKKKIDRPVGALDTKIKAEPVERLKKRVEV